MTTSQMAHCNKPSDVSGYTILYYTENCTRNVSDFERGLIVGAQMAGALVTKTAELAGVLIGTVSNVTYAFRYVRKTSEVTMFI